MANENTTSLDLPPALASLMAMQMPAVQQTPTPGLQTGITSAVGIGPQQLGAGMQSGLPSFQEGGMIPELGKAAANTVRRSASGPLGVLGLIPNPVSGAISAAKYLGQAASYFAPPPSPKPSPFGKYFPAVDQGAMDWGRIDISHDTQIPKPDRTSQPQQLEVEDNSYAEGGMVGMEGMRVPPGAVPGMPMAGVSPTMDTESPMDPQMMQMQINQVASRNPQALAEIRNAIMEELQSGDLTPQELNTIIQLTQVAANNPEMYPYVKQFAMQQGLAAAGDLPDKFDQGLIMVLLLAARAVQQDIGGAPAEMGQPPGSAAPVIPSMAKGGMLPSSGKSEPVIIEAHTGEYVIPKHVVDMKGKEFFDSLVEKYKDKK
jgi:hypothetical protein